MSGCASTSGHEWLNSPVDQTAQAWAASAAPETELAQDSRPRLNHTVTLGESYEVEARAAAPAGAPPVQVNVNTQVINNVGGYGYGYGYYSPSYGAPYFSTARASAVPVRSARSTESKVGADFPAPRDYGPRAMR